MSNMKKNIIELIKSNKHIHDFSLYIYNIPSRFEESYLHFKADYYLISFPKCGRTWLRLMVGKYIQKYYDLNNVPKEDILEVTPLHDYDSRIPLIRITHDDDPQLKRFDKIQTKKSQYKNKKIIFMVRDPRDVVVSLYFQFLKREKRIDKEIGISYFIRKEKGSLKSIIRFYNVWHKNRTVPKDFLKIKYEDLHRQIYTEDRYDELKKILQFIGFKEIDDDLLSYVAKYAAFDKMKRMEKRGEFKTEAKRLTPIDKNDEESYKTRKGKVGGYKEYCTKTDIRYMDELIKSKLDDDYQY